ncbi:MAG TPA: hypothetical protein VN450_04960 [Candidatus Methylomirabilis sp.]|nr:hypothetical protein [Candidatus Methylomirabilis sp.]
MKPLRNEKGFALAFVLILAAIALVMTLGMLFMVGRGSYVSGQQQRYRTAVETARGGVEATLQMISSRGNLSTIPYTNLFLDNTGVTTKLGTPTGGWGGLNNAITIDPTVTATYDMRIDLGAYRVYSKIVDTVQGNSGPNEGLVKSAVVNAGSGEVTVVSIPYLYTIEVLSQSQTNATERSRFSVLYQY